MTAKSKTTMTERAVKTYPPTVERNWWTAEYAHVLGVPCMAYRPYEYRCTGDTEAEAIAALHRKEAADTWSAENAER